MKLKMFCTAKKTINKANGIILFFYPQNGREYLQMKQLTKD